MKKRIEFPNELYYRQSKETVKIKVPKGTNRIHELVAVIMASILRKKKYDN